MKPIIQLLKNQRYLFVCLLLITGVAISSCGTDNDDDDEPELEEYSGDFIASDDEVTTSATGSTTATFDPETRELTYQVEWEGLSSPVVGMHFHDAGPVIHEIEGWDEDISGSVSGTATLSESEANDLANGDIYTQIHTEDFPGGEVISPLNRSGNNTSNTNPPNGGDY